MPSSLVGKPAVEFELPTVQGDSKTLADFRGHWLILVFRRHLA